MQIGQMRNTILVTSAILITALAATLTADGDELQGNASSPGEKDLIQKNTQPPLVKITPKRIPMDKQLLKLCIGPQAVRGPHVAAEVDIYVNETVVDYRRKNPGAFAYPIGSKFVKKKYPKIGAESPDIATAMIKTAETGKVTDWEFSMVRLSDMKQITPRGSVSCTDCHARYESRGYISRQSEHALKDYLVSLEDDDNGEAQLESAATLATRIRKLGQIRSVGGVSAANLGLTFVQPQRDKDTGFMVAGSNDTKSILSLKSINGVEIDALEKQMRPGAPGEAGSYAGFLGQTERLLQVMADDNRLVVENVELTHQDLARPLLLLGYFARKQRGEKEVKLGDLTFKVRARKYNGTQDSPFKDGTDTDTDVTVINTHTGYGLSYSLLVPQMIERYGFYEGKGTSYRVSPKMIIDVLRAERSTQAGGHQRLPFEPANDPELKQALELSDPTALTELDLWRADVTDAALTGLSRLTNLKKLNLSDTRITVNSMPAIANLTKLTELWLAGTKINDESLHHLSNLTNLRELHLTRTNVSDQGLPALSKLTSLRELGLSETKVTDEGLKSLRQMKSLTELSLLRTQVTDQGLMMLSELPSLKSVHTYGTKVTKEGQSEFKRRLAERSASGR